MKLWYKQPSTKWTDALPLGNGRIGAMVYGGVKDELLCLNEDSLWSGYPRKTVKEDGLETYKKVKELMANKEYQAASDYIEDHFLSDFTESYMPFGDLKLTFEGLDLDQVTDYERHLCLDTAVAKTVFTIGEVTYTREYFISAVDQALFVKLGASKAGAISLTMNLACQMQHEIKSEEKSLILSGVAPSHVEPSYVEDCDHPIVYEEADHLKGMKFYGKSEIEHVGGLIRSEGKSLIVEKADFVVIKVSMRTSFNGYDKQPYIDGKDPVSMVKEDALNLKGRDYEVAKEDHIKDYQNYYKRVDLSFDQPIDEMPTDQRLLAFQETRNDAHLYTLLFNYGRYLTITGSRENTQPTNLQGIWNKDLRPIWSCNFTININAQMNYWGTEVINLPELHTPLFGLIDNLSKTGVETADTLYGARGCASHHNTDIWALSTPVGGTGWRGLAGVCSWNVSFGWLTRHLFEHYEFSLDTDFLAERVYPAIKSAALFYVDILEENEEGYWWITPTSSPENKFMIDGKAHGVSHHATMSVAIVQEVFGNLLKCYDILAIEDDFRAEIEMKMAKLYPYEVGSKGQLLEWEKEYDEEQPDHRHISHLYPLYPANLINEEKNSDLFEACKKSLEIRGDKGTGWSLGWKINTWARLKEGDRALELLKNQLTYVTGDDINYMDGGGTYLNLFDAHPPFQIDGNYGAYAGICEMLLQSYDDSVLLLPALPGELPSGYVKGLRAKNGLELDIYFKDGVLDVAHVRSKAKTKKRVKFIYNGKMMTHDFAVENKICVKESDFR